MNVCMRVYIYICVCVCVCVRVMNKINDETEQISEENSSNQFTVLPEACFYIVATF